MLDNINESKNDLYGIKKSNNLNKLENKYQIETKVGEMNLSKNSKESDRLKIK
jgi:hypothetical protein